MLAHFVVRIMYVPIYSIKKCMVVVMFKKVFDGRRVLMRLCLR
jgi:hypothetical protein